MEQPPLPPQNQLSNYQAWMPTKNKPALIGYYLGFIGLLPAVGLPFAIAAIVLSVIGLLKHKQHPTPGAKGHAITGLILGIIPIALSIIVLFFLCL